MKLKLFFLGILTLVNIRQITAEGYSYKLFVGKDLHEILPFMSHTWRTVFNEYPYLYVGNAEEATQYFEWFCQLPHSAAVVAYKDEKPVGHLSGASFVGYAEHVEGSIDLFKQSSLKPEDYYYFGEAIVLPEHRGNKIIYALYEMLKTHVSMYGYTQGCFLTESHAEHPLKPKNYRELSNLWLYLGCTRTDLTASISWSTIQQDRSVKDQKHTLAYWLKDFAPNRKSEHE